MSIFHCPRGGAPTKVAKFQPEVTPFVPQAIRVIPSKHPRNHTRFSPVPNPDSLHIHGLPFNQPRNTVRWRTQKTASALLLVSFTITHSNDVFRPRSCGAGAVEQAGRPVLARAKTRERASILRNLARQKERGN